MPGFQTTPYDSAEYVLQIMRSLGNDAIQSLAGNLLNDNQPYVVPMLNSGYRHLQRKLAIRGFQTLKKTVQMIGVEPAGALDPGLQVQLSYTGFFDGINNHATPTLPVDLLMPLKLSERMTASTQRFIPMFYANDGLPSRLQGARLVDWVWQQDMIQMIGSTQASDLQLLYIPFLPDLVLLPTPSQVLILRAENALAYYTLAKWVEPRGAEAGQPPLAPTLFARGDECLKDIVATENMMKSRKNTRRQGYSRASHRGWGQM